MADGSAPGPAAIWHAALRAGRFLVQRDPTTGVHVFPPRVAAPGTGAALEWVEPSGLGTVYSTTVVRARPPARDHNVAIVELDEGVRLMSRVVDLPPAEVAIGLRVKAQIAMTDDGPLLLFAPVHAG